MKLDSCFVFTGVILRQPAGYCGLCIDTDVASDGRTPAQARARLVEAVNLYVESAIESNLPVLRPVPEAENPLRSRPEDIVETFDIRVVLSVKTYA